jgi:4-hydroxybenzoate polyprenyltransferase
MNLISEIWKLLRPRQWVKSGFVLMGVVFGDAWQQPETLRKVALAAVGFSLVASGVYILNDLFDRKSDATHEKKRTRPLAAGTVPASVAIVVLVALWIIGFLLGLLASWQVLALLLLYAALNVGYSAGLKHVVLLDVFIIAAGFMLRLLAGTSGVGIAPSQWILLCGLMVALFLGFAKRRAELYVRTSDPLNNHRKVLEEYQPLFLDKMIVITASCVILSYGLYTMSPATIQVHHTDALIFTLPFVIYGVFRYIYTLHMHTTGSDPAQEIFRDPHLVLSIAGWLIVTLWIIRRG